MAPTLALPGVQALRPSGRIEPSAALCPANTG
jgi:hypothetical protein